jgi:CDP-glucose 4,6-dehydratase
MTLAAYAGRRVLVTGHTGFKGAWLCEWLLALGAEVHGCALPPGAPALFAALDLGRRMDHRVVDIRDESALYAALDAIRPEFIFHLAAQSLVRMSYREPLATFATNVLGTAHLLESVRDLKLPCSIVVVTTDKCYENDGRPHRFREGDPLGGHDPYSASKAGAELVVGAYRDSFFRDDEPSVALASARAGNVIGGGDWAEDRLVPDCMRALSAGNPIPVRNPDFTRPWQHVLDPLGGYLLLGTQLEAARENPAVMARYAQAFNFGPAAEANRSVRDLVEEILRAWPGSWEAITLQKHLPEAPLLALDITKADEVLGWKPRWNFGEAVERTVAWYREYYALPPEARGGSMRDFTRTQIAEYADGAR